MTEQHGRALATIPDAPPDRRMHPLVQLAMGKGDVPDTDLMRELMALQREWEAGEARKAFDRSMIEMRRDLPTSILHDTTVDYAGGKGRVHYTHASLAKVCNEVVPIMASHGFSIRWTGSNTVDRVTVTCEITHRDGHSISRTMNAPIDNSGGKSAIQGIASSETMLRRYTLTGLLGIATAGVPEPTGEFSEPQAPVTATAPEARRRQCLAAWLEMGVAREEVELIAGAAYDDWTLATLDRLRDEFRQRKQPHAPANA